MERVHASLNKELNADAAAFGAEGVRCPSRNEFDSSIVAAKRVSAPGPSGLSYNMIKTCRSACVRCGTIGRHHNIEMVLSRSDSEEGQPNLE